MDNTYDFTATLAQSASMAQVKNESEVAVTKASGSSRASTRVASPSGSVSSISSCAHTASERSMAPNMLQRRCVVRMLDDLGTELELDKFDHVSVLGSSPTQEILVASVSSTISTPFFTPASSCVMMGTSPASTPFRTPASRGVLKGTSPASAPFCTPEPLGTSPPTSTISTGGIGDASNRSIARAPVSNLSFENTSARSRAADCSIMGTSPVPTLGTPAGKLAFDAALRTPVGAIVSTKPPSSATNRRMKQDASERSPLASSNASVVATPCRGSFHLSTESPSQTRCGGDASQRSSLLSTHTQLDQLSADMTLSISEDRCCWDALRQSLLLSMAASPSATAHNGTDASEQSPIVALVAGPLEPHCGAAACEQSSTTTLAASPSAVVSIESSDALSLPTRPRVAMVPTPPRQFPSFTFELQTEQRSSRLYKWRGDELRLLDKPKDGIRPPKAR